MANRNFASGGKIYSMHVMPVLLDCNFVVTPTNADGITSLKGPAISAVYMHTSTTPSAGNPNPANGYIYVKLQDSYSRLFDVGATVQGPNSGTPISISGSSVLTIGVPYTITSVGTSTTANWQAVGLPTNVTPAVGVSFIATVTGSGTGTGAVQTQNVSTISCVEVVGNPNLTVAAHSSSSTAGGYLILKCLAATNSGTTTLVATAPATGSTIRLRIHLSNSSITIAGE